MTRRSKPVAVAVLEVGRREVKLLAIEPAGRLLSLRSAPNEVRTGPPYPSCDTEHIWRWLMAALADLGERFTIQAIVPTSYGSTAALVNQADLVLPILDREANPPAPIAAAYAEVAPWFEECHCPIDPAGLTLGRQLFWLSRAFPDEFGRTRWILPFAQYWTWGHVAWCLPWVSPDLSYEVIGSDRRAGLRGHLARRPDPAVEPRPARLLVAGAARALGR
jgi:sugar (pentulose or hexulose) kinase